MRFTVKQLREYLDREEAKWTEEDKKICGEFEDIGVFISDERGVSRSTGVHLDICFGMILTKETLT